MATPDPILTAIFADYSVYATVPAFYEGYIAHGGDPCANPYDGRTDLHGQVSAQAYDRGQEAAMRYARATEGSVTP